RVVVAPQDTSNTYAVVDGGTNCCSSPALGFVFAGTTPAVSVTNTHFATGDNFASYRWDVTVPAGGTAILMDFAVQNAATDTQGAQTQAQSLVQLSNADALTGMSDSERSAVVNFTVPPLSGQQKTAPDPHAAPSSDGGTETPVYDLNGCIYSGFPC